jgi:hemerythrin-like metal-binding protein
MTTGVPEIDAQHQEWIRRFNEFEEAVVNRKGQEAIRSTLDFLGGYAETHFADEEAHMISSKSPALEENRSDHNVFRRKLAEIQAWVEREGASAVEVMALKGTLEEWLVNHICTIDVKLRGTGQ